MKNERVRLLVQTILKLYQVSQAIQREEKGFGSSDGCFCLFYSVQHCDEIQHLVSSTIVPSPPLPTLFLPISHLRQLYFII